jgi:hypothetical protein
MVLRRFAEFAASSVLLLCCLPCSAQEVAIHYAGETLYESDDIRVVMNVNKFGRWCFAPQRQANISVIFKGGPDTDFSATEQYQKLFKDVLWKAVEARCSPLQMIRAESFLNGVRIAQRDGSERSYSDPFLPGESEDSLYKVFVQNTQYGWVFTPGDTGQPTTLAARRASRPQDATLLAAQEKNRASSLRQAEVEKSIRSSFALVPFDTTNMRNPDFMVRIFHGQDEVEMETNYRFRLLFATYFTAFGIKCSAHLPKNAELVAIYQPTYSEQTTTWMNGNGFTWTTSVPVQSGKEKIAEVRVAPRYSTKVWLYAHSSGMTGISGSGSGLSILDALIPERAAKISQEFEDNRSDLVQLFSNYDCSRSELRLLAENLHRISQRQRPVQDEAIEDLSRKVAAAQTPMDARLTEQDVMQRLMTQRE